jgi:NAD(P)-dependent dehydrogenase (short-subunit alcohol dehydrogenase family)
MECRFPTCSFTRIVFVLGAYRRGQIVVMSDGVLFLASDEASFVTGAEFVIDGGFIAQ